ncbi:MAG: hypothetical protein J2P47_17565, partial [Acetobacteraceae bacterium]|nr:hypothetical protein [Acetobacteraceae bacterium]
GLTSKSSPVLREQPQACTMIAMKLSRDPLIHPRPRFPTAIAAHPEAIAWWDPNHAWLHAEPGDARHPAIEAFLVRYEPGFESA